MLGIGHLGSYRQRQFAFYPLHPWKTFLAHTLETTGTCTRFPKTRPEKRDLTGKSRCDSHKLLLALGATRTGNQKRPFNLIKYIDIL